MKRDIYSKVLYFLQATCRLPLRSHLVLGPQAPLFSTATFFDYVIVSQRRYFSSNRTNTLANALISAPRDNTSTPRVGELLDIIVLNQPDLGGVYYLGHVQWFVPVPWDNIPRSSAWRSR